MKDYSELKMLAENATPGEWSHEQDNLYFYEDGYTRHMMELSEGSDIGYVEQKHNSDFIAAANPEVILELIAEVERLSFREKMLSEYGCEYCAGSGHVHRIDGYYLGVCDSCSAYEFNCAKHEIEKLKNENESLKKDAARYRWLRDESIDPGAVIDKKVGTFNSEDGGYPIWEYRAGKDLDDAIDTAMIEVNNK